jgi:hypothetical protein
MASPNFKSLDFHLNRTYIIHFESMITMSLKDRIIEQPNKLNVWLRENIYLQNAQELLTYGGLAPISSMLILYK